MAPAVVRPPAATGEKYMTSQQVAFKMSLAMLNEVLIISIGGWSEAEKLGIAEFCGNQHNPDWRWKNDISADEFRDALAIYATYGTLNYRLER